MVSAVGWCEPGTQSELEARTRGAAQNANMKGWPQKLLKIKDSKKMISYSMQPGARTGANAKHRVNPEPRATRDAQNAVMKG